MNDTKPTIEMLITEMAQPVLRYLERYVGNPTVAGDLQQETLIRIARGYPTFAGHSSLKTWAFAIANRVAADYYRAPERQRKIVDIDEVAEIASPEPGIDTSLIEAEMNRCVREVIDRLPDTYRSALILHDLEGLTAAQIAEICNTSVPTVKIRIHRARKRLKDALGKQCNFFHDSENVFRCHRRD